MKRLVIQGENTKEHIDTLTWQAGECYADIAMILLLDCSVNTYYRCIYQKEYERLKGCNPEGVTEAPYQENIFPHLQRLAVVMAAVFLITKKHGWDPEPLRDSKQEPWLRNAADMAFSITESLGKGVGSNNQDYKKRLNKNDLNDMSETSPKVLLLEEMERLADYLIECGGILRGMLVWESDAVDKLRGRLKNLDAAASGGQTDFNWNELQSYLLDKAHNPG